jgi:cytochrome c1
LLGKLGETDRSGAGRVVEVYPAGTLRRWNRYAAGYKQHPAPVADDIVAAAGVGFADPSDLTTVRTSDHALDALLCALTARASATGRVDAVPADARELARVEGWIALPTCAPDAL